MATRIMVVLLLAIAVAASSVFEFQGADGMDFYQYWGIAQAQKLSGQELNSPYVNQSRYEEVLNAYADQSSDEHLKLSNRSRRSLQIPQTPLCYALFAWLPANYSLAFGIFQVVQIGLFLAALVILGLGLQGKPFEVLTLTLLLLLTYEPLVSDLKVGNLNSLQLFTLVGLTWMLNRIQASPESSHCLVSCIIFMAGLAFLPLLKPTLVLVALLLAACLWTLKGTAVFIRATLAAAGFSVILAALPCLLFGSFTVWLD